MNTTTEHSYQSPIGLMKIVTENEYLTELSFVDEIEAIIDPVNHSAEPPAIVHQCIEELIEYFNGSRKSFSIAIHQEGTDFQQRVWKELYEVPFGETMSYGAMARKMGDEKLVRAAANANGKNKIAIIVPCHRIIGADKALVGYAWGKNRKKWLLQHEGRLSLGIQTLF